MPTPITARQLQLVQSVFDAIAQHFAAEAAGFDGSTGKYDGSIPWREESRVQMMPNISIKEGGYAIPGEVKLGAPMQTRPSLIVELLTGTTATRFLIRPEDHAEVEDALKPLREMLPAMRETYIRERVK